MWPGEEGLAQPDLHLSSKMVSPFCVEWMGGTTPPFPPVPPTNQQKKNVLRMQTGAPLFHDTTPTETCDAHHTTFINARESQIKLMGSGTNQDQLQVKLTSCAVQISNYKSGPPAVLYKSLQAICCAAHWPLSINCLAV